MNRRLLIWIPALLPAALAAQTIQPGDVVTANFDRIAEFQNLAAQGWIFRDGDGSGTTSCAIPGSIASCGWGFDTIGGVPAARALSVSNSQVRRWIISPPINFAAGGSVKFRLRKDNFGPGGFDVRQSEGGSDTGDQKETGIDEEPTGSAPCVPGQGSFCNARRVRSSGASTNSDEPSCAQMFGAAAGVRSTEYCNFTIPVADLEPTNTGVRRIAFMMRTKLGNQTGPGLLLDSISIDAGGPRRADQALIYTIATQGTPQRGLSRHEFSGFSGFTALGPVNNRIVLGIDATPDGTRLFGVTASPITLVAIDPNIGVVTDLAPITNLIGDGLNATPTDLAIDPRTGQAFLSTIETIQGGNIVSRFYDLNLATGEALLRGNMNSNDISMASIDLAVSCTGQVIGHDIVADQLLSINRFSGQATVIGPTGVDANFAQGMDFNNTNGQLYGWVIGGTSGNPVFRGYGSFNLTTGAFSVIGNSPFAEIEGTFPTPCWLFRDGFQ
jgi:hypothetical protein